MSDFKLYQYDERLAQILQMGTDPETGELTENAIIAVAELDMEKEEKTRQIVLILKDKRARIKALQETAKAEADRYDSLITAEERDFRRLAAYLFGCVGGQKVKTDSGNVSWTTSTEVQNKTEFLGWAKQSGREDLYTVKTTTTETPSKTAIKAALENGEEIPFCSLQKNASIK